jgi:aquaporin rerated protein, other eukaryote
MNVNPPAATAVVLPFTRPRAADPENPIPRKLPGFAWLADTPRNHLVAMIGEFAGTFLFLFFAFTATQVANMSTEGTKGINPSASLYISLAFGFSLAVNAWGFFRISGGLFNPAVSWRTHHIERC